MHLILNDTSRLLHLLRAMSHLFGRGEPITPDLLLTAQDGSLRLMMGTPHTWCWYDMIPDEVVTEGSIAVRGGALLTLLEKMPLPEKRQLTLQSDTALRVSGGEHFQMMLAGQPSPVGHRIPQARKGVAFQVDPGLLAGAFFHLAQCRSESLATPAPLLGMHAQVQGDRLILTSCNRYVLAESVLPIRRGDKVMLTAYEKGLTILPAGIALLNQLAKTSVAFSGGNLTFHDPFLGTVSASLTQGSSLGAVGARQNQEPWPENMPTIPTATDETTVIVHSAELVPTLDYVMSLASEAQPDSANVRIERAHQGLRLYGRAQRAGEGSIVTALVPARIPRDHVVPAITINGKTLLTAAKAAGKRAKLLLTQEGNRLAVERLACTERVLLVGNTFAVEDSEPWPVWMTAKV